MTDRSQITEAVKLSGGAWMIDRPQAFERVVLIGPDMRERLAIRYGVNDQIVTAVHYLPGARHPITHPITTKKRERVLNIIRTRALQHLEGKTP